MKCIERYILQKQTGHIMQIDDTYMTRRPIVGGSEYSSPRVPGYVERNEISYSRQNSSSQDGLPSFKELVHGIRNEFSLPTTQAGRSYTHSLPLRGLDVLHRSSSFSISETNESKDQTLYNRQALGINAQCNRNKHTLPFATLAKVGGSQYYSSPDSVKKKEEGILSFLTWFLRGHTTLDECFSEMDQHLMINKIALPDNDSSIDILQGVDLDKQEFTIAREDFKKWVIDIPDTLYNNISLSLEKFTNILHELKIMKYNYIQENTLNMNRRTALEGLGNGLKEENNRDNDVESEDTDDSNTIGYNDSREGTDFSTSNSPSFKKLEVKTRPVDKKVTKPRVKTHHLKKTSSVKCKHCSSIETPEWRRGPDGSRTLCNACGLFFSKLSKRFGVDDAATLMKYRKENGFINDRTVPSFRVNEAMSNIGVA